MVLFTGAVARTRGLAAPARYAAAVAIVGGAFLLQWALPSLLAPEGYAFPLFSAAVLLAASLFGRGGGLLATALSAVLMAYFHLPPVGSFAMGEAEVFSLALFVLVNMATTLIIQALYLRLAELRQLAADLSGTERARALLLREFRHRTHNDLNALVGLLHLRARAAPSDAARDGLHEAARHAMALARVHARLTPDRPDGQDGVSVDSREFVAGLCTDLEAVQVGEGLRPVALVAEAEAHALDAGRVVPLGLVLNEAVTNALKYAFPDDQAGTVWVRFVRDGGDFVLTVADDGVGPSRASDAKGPTGTGLGTRLLRALAAQLRGSFERRPGQGGGTVVELRFPTKAPGLPSR